MSWFSPSVRVKAIAPVPPAPAAAAGRTAMSCGPVRCATRSSSAAGPGPGEDTGSEFAGGGHADDGLVQPDVAGRSEEAGVAEGEDPAVPGDQPVAPAFGRGRQADDRLGEVARAPEGAGVAEGVDGSRGVGHPVAAAAPARAEPGDLGLGRRPLEAGV